MVLRASIAEVPHRRYLAWGWLLGLPAVLAFAVGSVGWTTSDHASAPSPSPSASAVQGSPGLIRGFPDAPRMTSALWGQVDASWDLLAASASSAVAPQSKTALAVYVSAPGGERHLAFASDGLPDGPLDVIAWDPEARTALVATGDSSFRVANMQTGTYTELASPIDGPVENVYPLGRASDGRTYLRFMMGEQSGGSIAIVAWDGRSWGSLDEPPIGFANRLAGDVAIGHDDRELVTYNVVTRQKSGPLPGLADCYFQSWATDTDFSALCTPQSQDDRPNAVSASIQQGKVSDLGTAITGSVEWSDVPTNWTGTPVVVQLEGEHILVSVRTEQGLHPAGTMDRAYAPVIVTRAADSRWLLIASSDLPYLLDAERGTLLDLSEGFTFIPESYAFLPGTRD
ncbi:hypothetical protein [Demequina sp.]|uniref:hypothetical protein n=1 Tax=Demequina sp. TaxID=2050685 RepID=UPI003D1449B2